LALIKASQAQSVEPSVAPSAEVSSLMKTNDLLATINPVEASPQKKYDGPLATINAEGLVEETAEVKAAAKAFFEAYNAHLALIKASQAQSVESSVAPSAEVSPIMKTNDHLATINVIESSQQKKYDGPLATINAYGLVEETAEVKAATKAFFDVFNAQLALARASQEQSVEHSVEPSVEQFVEVSSNQKYNGPLATINAEGLVENTAEVKAATQAFFDIYNAQLAQYTGAQAEAVQHQAAVVHQAGHFEQESSFNQQYDGPHATVNAEGFVQNTAEVEAAAKAFFEAYNAQLALTRSTQEQSVDLSVESSVEPFVEVSSNQKYTGPLATINAEGHVEETAEVKAAAQVFFDAFQQQMEATASAETHSHAVQKSAEPLLVSTIVDDEAAAWAAHLLAFKHALATTGDFTPESQLAKDALLQAYMEVSLRDHQ